MKVRRVSVACRHGGHQRGQALAEFLISLIALVPIFLAITYVARYGDVQQQATQASRYAAFQRAMQPNTGQLSNTKVEDQMRARFFLAPLYRNQGHLRSDDSVAAVRGDTGQPALWRDLGGRALLASPQDVTVGWTSQSLRGSGMAGGLSVAVDTMASLVHKPYRGADVAQVEVKLLNHLDQTRGTPPPLRIGATTAAAGDGLGSAGSVMTRDAAAHLVLATKLPPELGAVLRAAVGLLERKGPDLGCIKPDVVPDHRLQGAANNSRCL